MEVAEKLNQYYADGTVLVTKTDGTVLVTETREHLQHVVTGFEKACDSVWLKINVGKSKVLEVKKEERGSCEKVRVSGEEMQEVVKFNYLGVMTSTDGGRGEEVAQRMLREERYGG